MRTNSFSNGQQRNNFRPSLSVEKLFEKCDNLILIDNGKLVSHGPLEEIKNNEKYFNLISKIKKKNNSDDL